MKIDLVNKPIRSHKRQDKLSYKAFLGRYKKAEMHKDIIKSSSKIKELLLMRFQELDLKPKDIIKDAKKRGMILHSAGFSRYFSEVNNDKNILTQFQILWLMVRFGIEITINIKKLDYVEKECLIKIEQLNQYK
jgi:hypothetical protein